MILFIIKSQQQYFHLTFELIGDFHDQCTRSCEGGVQMRHVACKDWLGRDLDEGNCNSSIRPPNEQPCNVLPCSSWALGDWNQVI